MANKLVSVLFQRVATPLAGRCTWVQHTNAADDTTKVYNMFQEGTIVLSQVDAPVFIELAFAYN